MNFATLPFTPGNGDIVFVSVLEIGGRAYIAEHSSRHESRVAVIEMAAKRNQGPALERERERAREDYNRDGKFINPHKEGTVERNMYWLATYELAELGHV